MSHIDKQLMQSHEIRKVMQQTIMQSTCISSKSTHKLNKKYDNRDEYLARITCSMIIMIIYNQENQTCQDEWDKQQEECTCQGEQSNHTLRRVDIWG